MPAIDQAPLILTLKLDPDAQSRFDALRSRHFPPERNQLSAHITLFHHLPGPELASMRHDLTRAASAQAGFALSVTGPRSLGRGVAFVLAAPELLRLRAALARNWAHWLGPQDQQGFRPHVTVQNKVDPAQAKALLASLQAEFVPWTARADALLLWHYRGGPWEPAATFPFA